MHAVIRIGTRASELAVWQASQVKSLLEQQGEKVELIFIKSEGDIDLITPLYEIGVQGIFTRSLDIALLNNRIDIAVHSMKDVPTKLPEGLAQAAVLKRGPVHDLLVYKNDCEFLHNKNSSANIATSSIRRKAQWLERYPLHTIHNLRGNINTRLKKLETENWDAAIFAQAGLERIKLRPENSLVLDWMLPAPAQGAIIVMSRHEDQWVQQLCNAFNDEETSICTAIEKDFLRTLAGGCSTPISALAEIKGNQVRFRGNIFSLDGSHKVEIEKLSPIAMAKTLGNAAAVELLEKGGQEISDSIRHETE
jgi:hydroxymethylbilane synthase